MHVKPNENICMSFQMGNSLKEKAAVNILHTDKYLFIFIYSPKPRLFSEPSLMEQIFNINGR